MKCNKCGIESDNLSIFSKDSSRKNGYKNWCLSCVRKRGKKYRSKNKIKINKKSKDNYSNNKEKIKIYYINRMINDPITYRAEAIHHGMKASNRKRGTEFDENYFSISNIRKLISEITHCPCCKVIFIFESLLTNQKNMNAPSADRKNNNEGYIKDNVIFICWGCNKLKRDSSVEEIEKVVEWLTKISK